MQKEYSDYTIHRRQDKLSIYQQKEKLWWSDELNRWICTDAALIKAILDNPQFEAPTYSVEKIIERIPVDLTHNINLVKYFPLAQEGDEHKAIRKRHARQLMLNAEVALESFNLHFKKNIQALENKTNVVNLYEELLLPSIQQFFSTLLEINISDLTFSDSISLVLDETLPLTKRIKINNIIGELVQNLPQDMSIDEKYFRVSMLALGIDAILGAISESVVEVISKQNEHLLSEMAWPRDIPATGVPYIERVATHMQTLNNISIKTGDKVRLYLDATGYAQTDSPSYSQIYFGAGRHLCLGMPVGGKIWRIVIESFQKTQKHIKIFNLSRREYDNVFNLYNKIEVSFYD